MKKQFRISWITAFLISLTFILVMSLFNILSSSSKKLYNSAKRSSFRNYFGDLYSNNFSTIQTRPAPPRFGKYENECRRILEEITGQPFPKIRPDWLKNPLTKKNLELDCYNPRLGIALEYDGQFHNEFSPFFHGTTDKFEQQKYKDRLKDEICKQKGIKLIRVNHQVPFDKLKDHIYDKLSKLEIN